MSDFSIRKPTNRVAVLGASVAAMAFALAATPAFADSSAAPDAGDLLGGTGIAVNVQLEAQSGGYRIDGGDAVLEPQSGAVGVVAPEPQILIANPGSSVTDRDPVNITGVAQMVINNGGGSVGLCTASLINPRTVIFAAHCVNTRTAGAYGAGTGGTPIAFGFEANTRANAAGQPDELLNWFNGASTGPGANRTNVAQAFYNANYVSYNPASLEPNAASFLYSDIATATLDTPAANIPTWALLFSQLPAVPITAAGTGYHVALAGYGNAGTGEGGATTIDFRRRIAENTLGALASLDEFENFLFGGASTTNPQNLFWIDFDDPRRGTALASPFDFNAWRDNALPNEGLTSGGDSGGPLILDRAYARSVILGVLSGGYTRFFNGQPANSYGTAAFYQPLYLYWDWIAANNPYHYVGSLAGNANWTDATHWVTNLDPAYQIIVNGALVNGVPTSPGAGNTDQPGYGQACFQSGGVSDCYDVASGVETVRVAPIGTAGNDAGSAAIAVSGEAATTGDAELALSGTGRPLAGVLESQAAGTTAALPLATIANGLPGATNFVPNNFDGNRLTQVAPRYFDVTLGAVGTTTLNSTVVIDRLTLANTGAGLDIQTTGSLTSLIGVNQLVGTMQVNGTLRSGGDYMMLAGGLNGTGTIFAPFFTSIAGTISPGSTGAAGTVGTLTFRGNTIFASGTTLLIDLGNAGTSDRVDVLATTFAGGNPVDGIANVGGRVVFSVATGSQPRAGDGYTILAAANAVTGTFAAPAAISAILTPQLIYSAKAVQVLLRAGAYASVVDRGSQVQTSYAALLDSNRQFNTPALADVYGPLDLQNAGTIQAFFENAAPRNETLRTALGVVASGTTDRFFRARIHALEPGEATGELAVSGNPLTLAAQGSFSRAVAPLTAGLGFDDASRAGGRLPDDMSGYLVGGYLNGSSAPMPAAASGGRDTFDGWFLAGGIEKAMGEQATFGFALSYADIDGTTGGVAQQASTRLFQGTVYVAARTDAGLRGDLRISAGALSTDSRRTVTLLTTPQVLKLTDSSLVFSSELGLGFDLIRDGTFSVVPRISARYESIGFDKAQETGGSLALTVERYGYEALEGRAGMSFSAKPGSRVRPFLEANYVHEFLDQPTFFTGSFIGGVAHAPFALAGTDNDWGEISGGIAFDLGSRAEISLEADTTVLRDDFRNQSYRGRITIHF
jgi:uncharacterized protein YhjY with autotransporter beta-barrel domain